jgi:hypothetical protein
MGYEPSNLSPWGLTLFRGDYGRMLGYLRGLEVGFLKNIFLYKWKFEHAFSRFKI